MVRQSLIDEGAGLVSTKKAVDQPPFLLGDLNHVRLPREGSADLRSPAWCFSTRKGIGTFGQEVTIQRNIEVQPVPLRRHAEREGRGTGCIT